MPPTPRPSKSRSHCACVLSFETFTLYSVKVFCISSNVKKMRVHGNILAMCICFCMYEARLSPRFPFCCLEMKSPLGVKPVLLNGELSSLSLLAHICMYNAMVLLRMRANGKHTHILWKTEPDFKLLVSEYINGRIFGCSHWGSWLMSCELGGWVRFNSEENANVKSRSRKRGQQLSLLHNGHRVRNRCGNLDMHDLELLNGTQNFSPKLCYCVKTVYWVRSAWFHYRIYESSFSCVLFELSSASDPFKIIRS